MGSQTSDHETRVDKQDHAALRLWLRLLTCTNLIERRIRQELRTQFESTLPRFDLMAQLERAPQGLRMSELSARMMVTGGNVTALTTQLEQESLIERLTDEHDKRATRVRLTEEGQRRFARMASEHEGWVVQMADALDRDELNELYQLLGKLKGSIRDNRND
jgi:DNA-binding MarR family transcriptional regulator